MTSEIDNVIIHTMYEDTILGVHAVVTQINGVVWLCGRYILEGLFKFYDERYFSYAKTSNYFREEAFKTFFSNVPPNLKRDKIKFLTPNGFEELFGITEEAFNNFDGNNPLKDHYQA